MKKKIYSISIDKLMSGYYSSTNYQKLLEADILFIKYRGRVIAHATTYHEVENLRTFEQIENDQKSRITPPSFLYKDGGLSS